jgi:nicotinate-nucleotide adenylyltransferase
MPTTLLFGGSFDPVHNGHLITAASAANEIGAHRVLLMPAAVSPHKTANVPRASARDRLVMLKLAAASSKLLEVSDLELLRPPPSYTIDTVEALRAAEPAEDFVLLIGADQIPKFDAWHRAADLRKLVQVAILARPGSQLALPAGTRSVAAPLVDISSTDIRSRVKAGQSIDGLVPPAVVEYIREHGLYR